MTDTHQPQDNGGRSPERADDPLSLHQQSNDIGRLQLSVSRRNLVVNIVLCVVLSVNAGVGIFASVRADSRQVRAIEASRDDARRERTSKMLATSFGLLSDGTWIPFEDFYRLNSTDRLRILRHQERGKSPLSPLQISIAGEDQSDARKIFSAMWWKNVQVILDMARALRHDQVEVAEILQNNQNMFGKGETVLPDDPEAMYDCLLSDLRILGFPESSLSDMESFREKSRKYDAARRKP